MTILTLNLHCYAEEHIQRNQQRIVEAIINHKIDIVCFQEACKQDGHGYVNEIKRLLLQKGYDYEVVFAASNIAFETYDEGVAILSRLPIVNSSVTNISTTNDYYDWKTRIAIHADIMVSDQIIRITSVHIGWTDDKEVFESQFDTLYQHINKDVTHMICGDFNIHDKSKEYLYVTKHLIDLWELKNHENAWTHGNSRIDYIMSNKRLPVTHQQLLFHEDDKKVSDHHGVLMTIER